MENEFNDRALRGMLHELAILKNELNVLEQAIAMRKHYLMGGAAPQEDTEEPVRNGQYRGIKPMAALENYLAERGGGPVKIKRIAVDLAVAGVKLGQEKRHIQNLKIGMSAGDNRNVFRYDEATDSVSLATSKS